MQSIKQYYVFPFIISILFGIHSIQGQTTFEIVPTQSMLLYGKGPGQDATINPFQGQNCYAIITNLGSVVFNVRVQQQGKIIDIVALPAKTTKKILLLQGHELYLDPASKAVAKAQVGYEAMDRESP